MSLAPGGKEAHEARAVIGDIYRDRFDDPLAAIAQYADIARRTRRVAPRYQLEVARAVPRRSAAGSRPAPRRASSARSGRRRRSPTRRSSSPAQAWALDKRDDEALGALQALVERAPRADVARALEGQAHIHAQAGRFDRALELYALALPTHPNPDAIRTEHRGGARAAREGRDLEPGRPRGRVRPKQGEAEAPREAP